MLICGKKKIYSGKIKTKTKTPDLKRGFSREQLQKIKISWIYKNFRETFEPVRVAESGRDTDVQEYHISLIQKSEHFYIKIDND